MIFRSDLNGEVVWSEVRNTAGVTVISTAQKLHSIIFPCHLVARPLPVAGMPLHSDFFFFLRGAFPFCDFQIYWHSRGPSPVMRCFSTHQCALRRACRKLTKKFLLHKEKAALWCRSILVLCALLSDEYFCPYQSSLPHTGLSAFISLQPEYSFMIEAAK